MADLKFTHTHEWLQYNADEAIIGISDHAQELLGDLVFIEMPEEGKQVNAGDELGVIESVKAAADFYAPISGTILSVNQEAAATPALVNSDPYGQGWLVKIQPNNPAELNNLLTADQYDNEIKG